MPQEAPRRPHRGPRMPQEASRGPQDPALLELRRNTWRGAADVEDAGIHGMTFKYAG